jgi:hypothetical protein
MSRYYITEDEVNERTAKGEDLHDIDYELADHTAP